MNKSERQAALTRIINQKPIATQEELLAALKAAGIDATQATISRDIREMKIVKSQDATGTLRYTIFRGSSESQLERLGRSIREVGLSITRVHFMNVIKRYRAMAIYWQRLLMTSVLSKLSAPSLVMTRLS